MRDSRRFCSQRPHQRLVSFDHVAEGLELGQVRGSGVAGQWLSAQPMELDGAGAAGHALAAGFIPGRIHEETRRGHHVGARGPFTPWPAGAHDRGPVSCNEA